MIVERFVGDDQQKVWEKEMDKGGTFYSGCIKTVSDGFDMTTGIATEAKHMNWVKANSLELLERTITVVTNQLKAGRMVPYRVYTSGKLYPTHELDRMGTNDGSEGAEIAGRYSDTRLGTPEKALELDKTFIEMPVDKATLAPPVVNEPIAQEE